MSKLAIYGGEQLRKEPFPSRTPFGEEEIALVMEAIRSQNLFGLGGVKVNKLQKDFAEFYGVKHAVASTSGTAAIHIAIGTINPEPGDEIITAPITDGGTIVPIIYQNCIPIFADVDDSYNMDPSDIERKITSRTAAILVVHLFGNACNMDEICDISRRHNIPIIEDVSQSHATKYKGRYLGTYGDIAAFSLQQSKYMTTGDGGMTITNRDDWSERMYLFRDKGWNYKPGWGARSYEFLSPNYRMTELQAAVGIAQIKKVRSVVEKRMELGNHLIELIKDIDGLIPPPITEGSEHGFWAFPLRINSWDIRLFADALNKEGVSAFAGYINEPIFICMEALAGKKTFGKSTHPFDGCHGGRKIDYTRGMCPKTEDVLKHIVITGFNENYTFKDIEDMAGAIRKVSELLPKI